MPFSPIYQLDSTRQHDNMTCQTRCPAFGLATWKNRDFFLPRILAVCLSVCLSPCVSFPHYDKSGFLLSSARLHIFGMATDRVKSVDNALTSAIALLEHEQTLKKVHPSYLYSHWSS